MYLRKYLKFIKPNVLNIPGYRTKRRIVVIESDDWGSIRMPSKKVYLKFLSAGFDISGSDYNRLDSLENNDDLELLFDALSSFKDKNGNYPVFTANVIVGNPDFHKIKESGFTKYYYEPVTDTLKNYPKHNRVYSLWKAGNDSKLFHPQFHGREHVNIIRWMNALQEKSPGIIFTFENKTTFSGNGDYNFMEVLDYNSPDDLEVMKESLEEGLDLFEMLFGYKSKSFIPPCYTWNNAIEESLAKKGVRYIQGLFFQSLPTGKFEKYKLKYHYLGQRNSHNQYYLIRNCFFEPALSQKNDPVGECLNRIKIAFRWNKPAVISTHRINYIGSLVEKNREDNLKLLSLLISQILKKWPETEFMTSDQLGDIISGLSNN